MAAGGWQAASKLLQVENFSFLWQVQLFIVYKRTFLLINSHCQDVVCQIKGKLSWMKFSCVISLFNVQCFMIKDYNDLSNLSNNILSFYSSSASCQYCCPAKRFKFN